MAINCMERSISVAEASRQVNNEKRRNNQNNGDNCRNGAVKYTIKAGGRRMDKPKLNFSFHNSNSPEALTRLLIRVCIDANMEKAERAINDEIALTLDENKVAEGYKKD